jgi:hypothetical protein
LYADVLTGQSHEILDCILGPIKLKKYFHRVCFWIFKFFHVVVPGIVKNLFSNRFYGGTYRLFAGAITGNFFIAASSHIIRLLKTAGVGIFLTIIQYTADFRKPFILLLAAFGNSFVQGPAVY